LKLKKWKNLMNIYHVVLFKMTSGYNAREERVYKNLINRENAKKTIKIK